ncbi:SGNH/GDSL hydrolase family protein [Camelliibacillus cellulosilyticus]|uniref:SGNH/GDSL hydrolase family protein n=1 Tax=Camelliibacillus cellulosilyticus TaxID=2174486 RepID=A0ABV9GLS3_9BACL
MPKIEDEAVVLFQGDSITDAGRDYSDPTHMGNGYAMMAAAWFTAAYPDKNVRFLNRGISGNRVCDLEARWHEDCLELTPTWLSILIGINDCWRRYDRNDPTSVEKFLSGYRNILERAREHLDVRLILCEPFVLPVPEDRKTWREDLDPKIQAVRDLAREYEAIYVPLDGIFAQAATQQPPSLWAQDGVHPTPAGHALIAQHWLRAIDAL